MLSNVCASVWPLPLDSSGLRTPITTNGRSTKSGGSRRRCSWSGESCWWYTRNHRRLCDQPRKSRASPAVSSSSIRFTRELSIKHHPARIGEQFTIERAVSVLDYAQSLVVDENALVIGFYLTVWFLYNYINIPYYTKHKWQSKYYGQTESMSFEHVSSISKINRNLINRKEICISRKGQFAATAFSILLPSARNYAGWDWLNLNVYIESSPLAVGPNTIYRGYYGQ